MKDVIGSGDANELPNFLLGIKPATYPSTDSAEIQAVNTFKSLVDSQQIKSHINERDKVPNYDGYLELLENGFPAGKVEVQIKYLNVADFKRCGFSCSLEFLAYCFGASLPFLLIGVSPENEKAFWIELSREFIRSLSVPSGQKSTTVHFPAENIIQKGVDNYYENWMNIASRHKHKIEFFDEIKSERDKIAAHNKQLEQIANVIMDEPGHVAIIQDYLDHLNGLLDGNYDVIKKAFFPNSWKLGFTYTHFFKNMVRYCMHELRRGKTTLPIRMVSKLDLDSMPEGDLTIRTYYKNNPIYDDPRGAAVGFVKEKLEQLFKFGAFTFDNNFLMAELLFSVIDKIRAPLGLAEKDSYQVEELIYSFYNYLPIWIDEALKISQLQYPQYFANSLRMAGYLDISGFSFGLATHDIHSKVRKRIESGERVEIPFPIGIRDVSLPVFIIQLKKLNERGIKTIARVYRPFDYRRLGGSAHLIYDWLSADDLFNNVEQFYKNIPTAFESVVKTNFPKLINRLNYFDGFNKLIVVVNALDGYDDISRGPTIRIYYFHSDENVIPSISVYKKDDPAISFLKELDFREPVVIDGSTYTLLRWIGRIADYMYQPQPLYAEILSELQRRFKEIPLPA